VEGVGQVEGEEAFLAAAGLADEVLRAAGPLEGLHHGGGLNLTQKRKDFINAGICTVNYTDKKENQILLIYKEIQNGAVAKSYMRKGFLIYEEMRKYLTI
jgi:hypothetical protein